MNTPWSRSAALFSAPTGLLSPLLSTGPRRQRQVHLQLMSDCAVYSYTPQVYYYTADDEGEWSNDRPIEEQSMVSAGRHPKKEIAEALKRAQGVGLQVNEIHRGHRWGEVICTPCQARRDVYSTPRDPGTHAKQIDRFTAQHTHSRPVTPATPSTT